MVGELSFARTNTFSTYLGFWENVVDVYERNEHKSIYSQISLSFTRPYNTDGNFNL